MASSQHFGLAALQAKESKASKESSSALMEFEVRGTDLAVVNALRRAILSDVPTAVMRQVPFDTTSNTIVIRENTSAMHNEMLGHRLSLVPLHFDENQLEEILAVVRSPSPSPSASSPADEASSALWEFQLRAQNSGPDTLLVTTKDFQVYRQGALQPDSVRNKLLPACPVSGGHILLLKLRPSSLYGTAEGERVSLEGRLTTGTGAEHACFCPVSVCHFNNKVDEALAEARFKEIVAGASGENKNKEDKEGEVTTLRRNFEALDMHRCFARAGDGEPAAFVFKLESECGLRPAYLVFKGLDVLRRKLARLRESLMTSGYGSALNSEYAARSRAMRANDAVSVEGPAAELRPVILTGEDSGDSAKDAANTGAGDPEMSGMYNLILRGEGHTLGNLLQALLYREYRVRPPGSAAGTLGAGSDLALEFVGYTQPHPLENYVIVRLKLVRNGSAPLAQDAPRIAYAHALAFLSDAVMQLHAMLASLCVEWYDVTDLRTLAITAVDVLVGQQLRPVAESFEAAAKARALSASAAANARKPAAAAAKSSKPVPEKKAAAKKKA